MAATVLDEMVVRLLGDATTYLSMLSQAQAATQKTVQKIEQSVSSIEQFKSKIEGFAGGLTKVLGAVGIAGLFRTALSQFVGMEQGALRLTAAIEANGQAAGPVIAEYKRFAEEMDRVNNIGKGTTLSMLRQAETLGLSGASAEKAVQDAIALGAATGQQAESMLRASVGIQQGNPHMAMYMLRLRGITGEANIQAAIQQKLTTGYAQQQAIANSLGGQIDRLKRSFEALTKQFGETIGEAIRPLVGWVTQAVQWFTKLDPQIRNIIGTVALLTAGVVAFVPVMTTAVTVFTIMTGGLGIWIGLAVAVGAAIGIWVNQMGGFTKAWDYIKAAVLPIIEAIKAKLDEFVVWASPLWKELSYLAKTAWQGILDLASTVFLTIRDLIGDLWQGAKEAWQGIFGEAEVNWNSVRDVVRDVMISLEFTIKHFGEVVAAVWEQVTTGATDSLNKLRDEFAVFREQRMADINRIAEQEKKKDNEAGDNKRNQYSKSLKELSKFNAALSGSAEAAARVAAYQARMAADRVSGTAAGAPGSARGDQLQKPLADTAAKMMFQGISMWDRIKSVAFTVVDTVKGYIIGKWNEITTFVTNLWTDLTTNTSKLWNDLVSQVAEWWDEHVQAIFYLWDNAVPILFQMWDTAVQALFDTWDDTVDWVEQAFSDFITVSLPAMWQGLVQFVTVDFPGWVWDIFGVQIPTMWQQIVDGALALWPEIRDRGIQMWWDISARVYTLFEGMVNRIIRLIPGGQLLQQAGSTVSSTVSQVANSPAVAPLTNAAINLRDAAQFLRDQQNNAAGTVIQFLGIGS